MANFPSMNNDNAEGGGAAYYKGQFASLKFPKFKQQEYPKQIKNAAGKILGRAENALQESEILEKHGLEHSDVDPVAHLSSENAALKAKLALYEGTGGGQIAAAGARKATQSVEMLPEAASKESEPTIAQATVAPASVSGNPLLKDKMAPVANAAGKAPVISKTVDPGV